MSDQNAMGLRCPVAAIGRAKLRRPAAVVSFRAGGLAMASFVRAPGQVC